MVNIQKQADAAALRGRVAELKAARRETVWRLTGEGGLTGDVSGHPEVKAHDPEIAATLAQALVLEAEALRTE